MKKLVVAAGLMSAVVLVSGCRSTNVAGVTRSQEEQNWEQMIRRNYPGYRAPRAAAPADFNNTEERTSAVITPLRPEAAPEPAATPAPEALPEVKNDAPAVVPEAPKADAPAAVPEAPKAGEKAEVKVEAPKSDAPAAPAAAVQPPDPTSGKVYVVKSGDTLGGIAQKTYGKAAYSNLIFKANSDILKNPNQLRPGMKLIIPTL
ncbi:MAG: LysM peptidoglycan-binding domain-containing protein [Lentisphaerae bacterium]|nr:LysM peptidoglycan-binding domain-containing protein [Lentisphaerota bacterium]